MASRAGMRRVAMKATAEENFAERAAAAMALDDLTTTAPPAEREMAVPAGETFPLGMVVGQEAAKAALLLAAVNPDMGGVIISGGRGTCKSVMSRGLHRLLPPIEVVKGSAYNIDPEGEFGVDTFLSDALEREGKGISDLETEMIPAPFVQVPLNVMEDRLLGSVDVEESVKQGKTVFQPGLLARAHRGILYLDDINLLDNELANILLGVISDGFVRVEREGVSVRYPCKPILVATFNPEEADVRDHILDRIAVSLSVDAVPLSLEERIEAVEGVLSFSGDKSQLGKADAPSWEEVVEMEEQLKTRIVFAREELKETQLSEQQMTYICEEASRAGCQGQRAELFAVQVARASAALEGRAVEADDLRQAVKLAIMPRGTFLENQMDDMDMQMPPPPPPPPPPQQQELDEEQDQEDQPDVEDEQEEQEQEDQPDEAPQMPEEFMFDIEGTPIDPELLAFAQKQKSGKSGGRGLIFSQERGRYIKPMLPKGKVRRLAVDATMRTAAPFQAGRRKRAVGTPDEKRKVFIEQSDVRVKRMARKAGSLIIFMVDASGSMALNRMNAAKGACMSLLEEAYQSRDKISLIPFQGDAAEVLLPPTKSIAMATRRLESMPCGGGSPLAHAINTAVKTGTNAMKSGDVGKTVLVLISDGRANVPLSVSNGEATEEDLEKPDKEALKQEVLDTARQLQALNGFSMLVIDTENKFVSTGMAKEIADAAGGKYHYIPKATEQAIAGVASAAVASMKE
mmetsp:Transcript_14160/g.42333  ORF Transcript_14160/g.42333 Transcript_14160/m.42333 type:complete len:743 (-) Transcript_14160:1982-4210(-)